MLGDDGAKCDGVGLQGSCCTVPCSSQTEPAVECTCPYKLAGCDFTAATRMEDMLPVVLSFTGIVGFRFGRMAREKPCKRPVDDEM